MSEIILSSNNSDRKDIFSGKVGDLGSIESKGIEYVKVWRGSKDAREMLEGYVRAEVKRLGAEVIRVVVEDEGVGLKAMVTIRSKVGII